MIKAMPGKEKKGKRGPIAAALFKYRESIGLTQAQAAERAQVSLSTWICWENDQRKPSGPARKLLAIHFPDLKIPD